MKRDKYDITIKDLYYRLWSKERKVRIVFGRKYGKSGSKFICYSQRAWDKGLSFSLTVSDFIALDSLSCIYCGDKPTGYDRYNNDIGYIKSNIVPCFPSCNMMKFKGSHKEFMLKIRKIYNFTYRKR